MVIKRMLHIVVRHIHTYCTCVIVMAVRCITQGYIADTFIKVTLYITHAKHLNCITVD